MLKNKDGWSAEKYKKFSSAQEESGKYFIEMYPFRGDEAVLDIGCGDGRTTETIAARVPRGTVLGIDPSADMIALAQKSFAAIKNLSFKQASAEELNAMAHFDLIVSFHALHYATDHLRVLHNVHTALKPHGVFTALMGGGNQQDMAAVFSREPWKNLIGNKMKWNAKNESEYRALLEEAGFSDFEVETVAAPITYPTKEALFNWLMTFIPFLTGLDQEHSRTISKEIVEHSADEKNTDIIMVWPILYVRATK